MQRIIYISSSQEYLNGEKIEMLLGQSRKYNLENKISGILIYIEGDFLQVIEGPKFAILDLFESIKKDSRHKRIMTIVNTEIKKRSFPKWNMGFCAMDYKELKEIKGYENLSTETLSKFSDKTAHAFITSFINSHRSKVVFV
jgi:hypothetical protein